MLCFGENFGSEAQNSQDNSKIRTKLHQYKVWSFFGLQFKFHQNRTIWTRDMADSKSYLFLGGRFFTEWPITFLSCIPLYFYSMDVKPLLRVRCVQNLEKFGPTVQEIWPNEYFKFPKNDPRGVVFMKFSIHAWNFQTIARNGFSRHQTTCTVIFGRPKIQKLQKKWAQNSKNGPKNAQNLAFFGFDGL